MQTIQLQLWNEKLTLDNAFLRLMQLGAENPTLKELAKGLLFERNFEEYQITIEDKNSQQEILKQFADKLEQAAKETLDNFLKKTNQSEETMIKRLVYHEQINRLKNIVVSDESIREAFIKRKPKMDRIMFALIRVDKEHLAQELFYRIRDDHYDFGELAIKFSVGPEAPFSGIVGPKPVFELNPELRKYLSRLKDGEVSEPFTLDGKQFFIAKLIKMEIAQLTQVLENEIRDDLFEQWIDRQLGLANVKTVIVSKAQAVSSTQEVHNV